MTKLQNHKDSIKMLKFYSPLIVVSINFRWNPVIEFWFMFNQLTLLRNVSKLRLEMIDNVFLMKELLFIQLI